MDAARYAAASARTHGLVATLLARPAWDDLVNAASLPAALDVLKRSGYGDLLADIDLAGHIRLELVEQRLNGRAADYCRRAMTFATGAARRLLTVWWQHYEIENLKALFRGVHQAMDPAIIQSFLIPLGAYSTLPWERLMNERSVASLVDGLADTHYANPLRVAYPRYQREEELFVLEIALDIRYYRDLAAAVNPLGGSDRAEARRIIGARMDILNTLWAYRYRAYYGLSAEEIVNYTLWHTLHTDADLVRAIALDAPIEVILPQVFGVGTIDLTRLDLNAGVAAVLPQLELTLSRYMRRLALKALQGYPFRIAVLLAYLILQEFETQDMVTVLEAKGMGWPPERIAQHLVRGEE